MVSAGGDGDIAYPTVTTKRKRENMAKRVKVSGEFILTTEDEDELSAEDLQEQYMDQLETGLMFGGTTYYVENHTVDFEELTD